MWATSYSKFNTKSMIFCFPQRIIKYDFFEKYFNFVLKMPSQKYWVILFIRLNLSGQFKFFSSSSLISRLLSFLIIYGNSSYLRSGQDTVKKHMGIPNCLIIASMLYKSFFQLFLQNYFYLFLL